MKIIIQREEKTPLYIQVCQQIRHMIFSGNLVNGYKLPSERSLAAQLKVHRNTIVRAYSELKDEGIITSYQGQGYIVKYGALYHGMAKKPVNWQSMIKAPYLDAENDFDELFSKSYEDDIISFGGGMAAREPYPAEEIAEVFEKILTEHKNRAYFYTPYQGHSELLKEIVFFMRTKGVNAKTSNVQIFSENNQALDFIMTMMLTPGDKVITTDIVSPDVYRTIQFAGGKLITVPMDENGMICEVIEGIIEKTKPKFIYVDSSFHNPTGIVLSEARKRKLLEISYRYRIPIIEEDEGSELYYDGREIPSIKSMDIGNNVIYMYSFSLNMMPGAGLSFVIADADVVKRLSRLVSMRVVTLDWAPQMLAMAYMKSGIFAERLDELRKICMQKRDLMCKHLDSLAHEFRLHYIKPEGGVYLWVRLPAGMEARTLLKEAHKVGITFIPGHVFYPKRHAGNEHIRLNYSYPTLQQIDDGMNKFEEVIRQTQQKIQKKYETIR